MVRSASDDLTGDVPEDDAPSDGVNWEFNFGDDDGFDKEPENMEEAMAMAREAMEMRSAQAQGRAR